MANRIFSRVLVSVIIIILVAGGILIWQHFSALEERSKDLSEAPEVTEGLRPVPEGKTEEKPIVKPLIETPTEAICPQYQEYLNNKCMLKYTPYKLGLVYVSWNQETYNPDWRTKIEGIINKVEEALKEISNNKIDASITMLGEVQTNILCWNSAKLGIKYKNLFGENPPFFYTPLPGSSFGNAGISFDGEILELDCPSCKVETDDVSIKVTIDCDFPLGTNLRNRRELLREQISEELGINWLDYNGILVIFGRLGVVLPSSKEITQNSYFINYNPNSRFVHYHCHRGGAGPILGWSTLEFSENALVAPYYVDCSSTPGQHGKYFAPGWFTIVHEILHKFGAVDVYETGLHYGIKSHREEALKIDSKTDESIMGNKIKEDCMERESLEKDGNICTLEELERAYLDKYNRQIIGLE